MELVSADTTEFKKKRIHPLEGFTRRLNVAVNYLGYFISMM